VEKLKKGFISFFVVAFIFSFNLSVLANEGHNENVKQATEDFRKGTNGEYSEEADTHSEEADSHSGEAEAHDKEAEAHPEAAEVHSDAANAHSEAADVHGEEEDIHDREAGAHTEEEEAHGDEAESGDHHGTVVETPPNYKVLGSYGAVNLSFILIGVWNKWFRRKGNK
jgi:hypothetical protein